MPKQWSPLDLQPPRYAGISPSTRLTAGLGDSLLSPLLPCLTHGGITGCGTTQPGPHLLGLSANLGIQGRARRLSSHPICHKPYPRRLQGIGNCPSPQEAANSVGIESMEHPRDDCLFRSKTWRDWGFAFLWEEVFHHLPPSLHGAYTKSSGCHPQTRAQGQGETFKCK